MIWRPARGRRLANVEGVMVSVDRQDVMLLIADGETARTRWTRSG